MNDNNWIKTFPAKDGTGIRVRRIGPQDVENLIDLFDHMGPESRYRRFHRSLENPPVDQVRAEAARIANADPAEQMGLIAFADLPDEPAAPIGVARYVRTGPKTAEIAMSIRDDCQSQGIGTRLLQLLVEEARADGLETLTGDILNENEAIWVVIKRLPYAVVRRPEGSFSAVEVDLTRPERFEAVAHDIVINAAVPEQVALIEQLPPGLGPLIAGRRLHKVTLGHSGNLVYRLDHEDVPDFYLKVAPAGAQYQLGPEKRRLDWLQGKLPTPEAPYYQMVDDGTEYLLTTAVSGRPVSDPGHAPDLEQIVPLLADGLRQIHAVPIDDCPFDQRMNMMIELARLRLIHDQVDESDFAEERQGQSAVLLFEQLLDTRPKEEDLVFTHGDYCLPNVIIEREHINGFIDVGFAGVGDRYRDLALAIGSLTYNFGEEWVPLFLETYGIRRPDRDKMAFYRLLNEFF